MGSVIRMETPVLTVGRLRDVLLAVTPPDQDPWRAANRLRPKLIEAQNVGLADQDTLVRLFSFPPRPVQRGPVTTPLSEGAYRIMVVREASR